MLTPALFSLFLISSALAAVTPLPKCKAITPIGEVEISMSNGFMSSSDGSQYDGMEFTDGLGEMTANFDYQNGLVFHPANAKVEASKLAIRSQGPDGTYGESYAETLKGEACLVEGSNTWKDVYMIDFLNKDTKVEEKLPVTKKEEEVPECKVATLAANEHRGTVASFYSTVKNEFVSNLKTTYAHGSSVPSITAKFVPKHGLTITTAKAFTETLKLSVGYLRNPEDRIQVFAYLIPAKESACKVRGSDNWATTNGLSILVAP